MHVARVARFRLLLFRAGTRPNLLPCACARRKASGQLKITHERYKNPEAQEYYMDQFKDAMRHNDALEPHLRRMQDDLNPLRVRQLLQRVGADDCLLLDLCGRPEDLLMVGGQEGGAGSNAPWEHGWSYRNKGAVECLR